MKLPEILDFRGVPDDIPRRRSAALVCTVANDGNAGRNGSKKSGAVALPPAVMRDDEDIDRSQLVHGTNKRDFARQRGPCLALQLGPNLPTPKTRCRE